MNENKENNQVKNSVLEENSKFKQAINSKNEMLKEKDEVIKSLQDDLGNNELIITSLTREKDLEKSLRIKAEAMVANQKTLEKPDHRYVTKTKDEQFADAYREACQKLRN